MRHICYERYGKIENLTNWDSSTIIEIALSTYGVEVDMIEEVFYFSEWDIPTEMKHTNKPLLLGVLGSSVYGNHLMAICGYETWTYKKKILFFIQTKSVILAEVKDGWTEESRYFNFDTFNGIQAFSRIKEV